MDTDNVNIPIQNDDQQITNITSETQEAMDLIMVAETNLSEHSNQEGQDDEESNSSIITDTTIHSSIASGQTEEEKKKKKKKSKSDRSRAMPKIIRGNSYDYDSLPDSTYSLLIRKAFDKHGYRVWRVDETEQIKYFRQYTKLMDEFWFSKQQRDHWKQIYHLGRMQDIWNGRVTKKMAEEYSICQTYGRSKAAIEKYLTESKDEKECIGDAIDRIEYDHFPNCEDDDEDPDYHRYKIMCTISEFVQEKQKLLLDEFELKRQLLKLDATDHALFQQFLDLKPNKSFMGLAQCIWEQTAVQMKTQRRTAVLQYRLVTCKPFLSTDSIHRKLNDINSVIQHTQSTTKSNEIATALISDELDQLHNLKRDIITKRIKVNQEHHNNSAKYIREKQQKYASKKGLTKSQLKQQKAVLKAIEARRLHMIKRANLIINYEMKHEFVYSDHFDNL